MPIPITYSQMTDAQIIDALMDSLARLREVHRNMDAFVSELWRRKEKEE